MNKNSKDIIIVGFALFAIFFGAGNLIFPPYLGVLSGSEYKKAMLGFLLTDPVLPILGVIATAKMGGGAQDLGKRVGTKFSKALAVITILTIGPLFAIPRTAATTHEVFVSTVFPSIPVWLTALVFFALTIIFVFNESGVIDKIGKYLTPGLVLILLVIIVKCLINPIGPTTYPEEDRIFLKSLAEGYQTMDALAASILTSIIVTDLFRRGYSSEKERLDLVKWVGLIAFVLLAIIYGGLIHVGATASSLYTVENTRVDILLGTVQNILGPSGKLVIGLAVSLACLTTSVGLCAVTASFFSDITDNRLNYKLVAILTVLVATLISMAGVEGLISAAVPVLSTIYPVIIVLILFGMVSDYIKYDMTYKGAVLGCFVISLIQSLHLSLGILEGPFNLISRLPLSSIGFEWALPSLVVGLIFGAIAKFKDGESSSFTS